MGFFSFQPAEFAKIIVLMWMASYYDKYGAQFKEFKELLDQEFQRCYKYFKKLKKQLVNLVN